MYIIIASSLWWIWRYRNSITFCPHSMGKSDIFENIRSSSFSWLHHRGHMSCNWVEWLKNPLLLTITSFTWLTLGISSISRLFCSLFLHFIFFPGTCLGLHQKHYGVKTGVSAFVSGGFSLVSVSTVIGKSFFIPFVSLAVKVSSKV